MTTQATRPDVAAASQPGAYAGPVMWGRLTDRLDIWKQVLGQGGRALVALLVGWAVTLLLLIRDNFLPDDWRSKLQFSKVVPRLTISQWLTVAMILLLLFTLEGAYRLVGKNRLAAATDITRLQADVRRLEAERRDPDFVVAIEQTVAGHNPEFPNDLAAFVNVSLLNRGAPSIADQWGGYVKIAGTRREAKNLTIPENTTLHMHEGSIITLHASDAIYEKGMTRVETGAMMRGWLCLLVEGAGSAKEFFVQANGVEVRCEDYLGHEYRAVHDFRADRGPMRYYPGSGGGYQKQRDS
jgi:hypothetical protein